MSRLSRPQPEPSIRPTLVSRLELAYDGTLSGFVYDAGAPERRYSVEILLDGLVFSTSYADAFVPELAGQGLQGTCGFAVTIEPDLLRAARTLEARLANPGTPVGQVVDLESDRAGRVDLRKPSELRWLGGLHFQGWLDSEPAVFLEAIVDGEAVAPVHATAWTHIGENAARRNARAFDFHVPQRFADGRVHRVSLRREDGEQIPATAVFVAFPDGLAGMIDALGGYGADRLRGKLYDQLIPASLPLADYVNWRGRFPLPAPQESSLPLAVVVAGAADAQQTLATLEGQTHENWTAGVIDGEPLCVDTDALLEFLDDAASDAHHVVIAMAGVVLEPNALARIASRIRRLSRLYGDLDFLAGEAGSGRWPFPRSTTSGCLSKGTVRICSQCDATPCSPASKPAPTISTACSTVCWIPRTHGRTLSFTCREHWRHCRDSIGRTPAISLPQRATCTLTHAASTRT
ncbi:hypothetical protein [Bradyrhizobium yuanmingense]|uniref:Uncharacterized protein n=1 Tax=Bradyrhizobium yuanmingense TaxID=108015 RepID=A0ABV4G7E7_9BRAD|nr:hypothetical protein [Bradyrhizobium yuanmingense]